MSEGNLSNEAEMSGAGLEARTEKSQSTWEKRYYDAAVRDLARMDPDDDSERAEFLRAGVKKYERVGRATEAILDRLDRAIEDGDTKEEKLLRDWLNGKNKQGDPNVTPSRLFDIFRSRAEAKTPTTVKMGEGFEFKQPSAGGPGFKESPPLDSGAAREARLGLTTEPVVLAPIQVRPGLGKK